MKFKTSDIPAWAIELFKRFCTPKTPVFFTVLKYLGLLAAAVAKAPDFLNSVGVVVPTMIHPYDVIIQVSGIVTFLVSQLTVQSQPAQQVGDKIVNINDKTTLPFTAKKEATT